MRRRRAGRHRGVAEVPLVGLDRAVRVAGRRGVEVDLERRRSLRRRRREGGDRRDVGQAGRDHPALRGRVVLVGHGHRDRVETFVCVGVLDGAALGSGRAVPVAEVPRHGQRVEILARGCVRELDRQAGGAGVLAFDEVGDGRRVRAPGERPGVGREVLGQRGGVAHLGGEVVEGRIERARREASPGS